MQLITILLTAVAVLTILTGIAVLCGTTKRSRIQGFWFFLSTIGAALWSLAIAAFFTLPEKSLNLVPGLVVGIISGITLADVALLGYTSWANGKAGKILTLAFGLVGAGIVGLLIANPSLFYLNVTFGTEYNQLHVVHGWYFYLLIAYFTIISVVYSDALGRATKRLKSRGARNGLTIFRAGLSIGGILALIFDLLLITSCPGLVWIGPMAVSISIISFYYSIVKYRILALSGRWMEVLSYVILIALTAVAYMLIFYAVFTAIFRIPNPSSGVLILNLIMTAVVLCAIPALTEVTAMIKSLLPASPIDLGYITKKLNRLNRENVELKELASFLAMTLKFNYVGLFIDGRLYESSPARIPGADLNKIEALKAPENGIWQDVDDLSERDEVIRVAALVSKDGKVLGQVLLGHQLSRRTLERRDLIEIEMVLKLVAAIVEGN